MKIFLATIFITTFCVCKWLVYLDAYLLPSFVEMLFTPAGPVLPPLGFDREVAIIS